MVAIVVIYVAIKLSKRIKDEDEYEYEDEEPMPMPMVNQIWYKRTLEGLEPTPWPNEDEAVKIINVRGDWLRYKSMKLNDNPFTIKVSAFMTLFMRDEFGDFTVPNNEPDRTPVAHQGGSQPFGEVDLGHQEQPHPKEVVLDGIKYKIADR